MKTRLLGYFVTYRWELWLIIGIPAVFVVVRALSFSLSGILLSDRVGSLSIINSSRAVINAGEIVVGIVVLILLSVSYIRVRRLERELLASLWGYSIAVAVIGVVAAIAVIVVAVAVADPEESRTVSGLRITGIRLFASFPQYIALLWFARQLSRVSLTHAFFLVAFTSLYLVIPIQGSLLDGTSAVLAATLQGLIGGFVGLIVVLIKVWLLGNFDRRGDRFRKEAIIILVATVILSDYARVMLGTLLGYLVVPREAVLPLLGSTVWLFLVLGFVFNLVALLMLFGVGYLVRIRKPKTLDATPVPASNC